MDSGQGGVGIDRHPGYVDDRGVIRISHTAKEARTALQYSVHVDLANETVRELKNRTQLMQYQL